LLLHLLPRLFVSLGDLGARWTGYLAGLSRASHEKILLEWIEIEVRGRLRLLMWLPDPLS